MGMDRQYFCSLTNFRKFLQVSDFKSKLADDALVFDVCFSNFLMNLNRVSQITSKKRKRKALKCNTSYDPVRIWFSI